MKREKIEVKYEDFPEKFYDILKNCDIYDSSCSPGARVYFIDKDQGYFLKRSPKGSLEKEALMTDYFHKKGLSANVCEYLSDEQDWLLSEKVNGEDCIFEAYLREPKLLCDTIAENLRMLHSLDFSDCPIQNRNEEYYKTAINNCQTGNYDKSLFPDSSGYTDAESAIAVIEANKSRLKSDVLLHGDYCLPNIMLDNWKFSGFIDLGNSGVGDRHIDLFWGAWTLNFNLHTEQYRERFFDAYGRQDVNFDMLRVIAAFEVFG